MCKENTSQTQTIGETVRVDLLPDPIRKEINHLFEIHEQLSDVEDDIEHCWVMALLLEQCLSYGYETGSIITTDIILQALRALLRLSDMLTDDFKKTYTDYQNFFENKKVESVESELKGGV